MIARAAELARSSRRACVLGGVAAVIAGLYAEEPWRCAKTSKG